MSSGVRHVTIKDRAHGLPYSKGLMASSLTICGIQPAEAFRLAEKIEEHLIARGEFEVQTDELRDLAAAMLREVSESSADTYLRWQEVEELSLPLVILIGGATGVGKSTIATQLAARLGITRVISTDAIREVLRSALSPELVPALHVSSFDADTLASPLSQEADPVILGFQEQVRAVSVGIKALIARAQEERTDLIVEGAHVVPGFLDGWKEEFPGAVLVPVVIEVGSEEVHRSHFHLRAEGGSRPGEKYLAAFDKIRSIQAHILRLARERDVEIVEAFDLDSTLQKVIAVIVQGAFAAVQRQGRSSNTETGKTPSYRSSNWAVMGRRKGL